MADKRFIEVPGCKKTLVEELLTEEGLQVMHVHVQPGGEIPLHRHSCAATMVVTQGYARKLGVHQDTVQKGDVVTKKPYEEHGFTEVKEPFSFISVSYGQGIMRKDGWNINYL